MRFSFLTIIVALTTSVVCVVTAFQTRRLVLKSAMTPGMNYQEEAIDEDSGKYARQVRQNVHFSSSACPTASFVSSTLTRDMRMTRRIDGNGLTSTFQRVDTRANELLGQDVSSSP
ncbi:hypothetical protein EDD22DRAFT_850747 [Suillus occidentalis]|nr:hypothetical protein EDD22DRAFT_850747 [Suillus occidentalis]